MDRGLQDRGPRVEDCIISAGLDDAQVLIERELSSEYSQRLMQGLVICVRQKTFPSVCPRNAGYASLVSLSLYSRCLCELNLKSLKTCNRASNLMKYKPRRRFLGCFRFCLPVDIRAMLGPTPDDTQMRLAGHHSSPRRQAVNRSGASE